MKCITHHHSAGAGASAALFLSTEDEEIASIAAIHASRSSSLSAASTSGLSVPSMATSNAKSRLCFAWAGRCQAGTCWWIRPGAPSICAKRPRQLSPGPQPKETHVGPRLSHRWPPGLAGRRPWVPCATLQGQSTPHCRRLAHGAPLRREAGSRKR